MNSKAFIVRYGELALKGKNRPYFERQLEKNIAQKIGKFGQFGIRRLPCRILIEFSNIVDWESFKNSISNVFGYSSASPVILVPPTLGDLEKAAVEMARAISIKSFAVRVKRGDKGFPLTSPEIARVIGAGIAASTGAPVDLSTPAVVFNVEVLKDMILVSTEEIKGRGGLPTGVSGRLLSLISGGIDSPVASWMMMKRGAIVDFVHFHSSPFTDRRSIEKVLDLVEVLSDWQGGFRIALVPFGRLQEKIVMAVPSSMRIVIYRRFMMRIASRLAERFGADGLVTGEALGQVASQTLKNIMVVDEAATLPVFRPLIGCDKQEITDIAREIGTYEISILPHKDCCTFLEPRHPVLAAKKQDVSCIEEALPIEDMLEEALREVEVREGGD